MARNAFIVVKTLDGVPGDAGIELFFSQLIWHRVIMPLDLHVVINVDPDLFPFRVGISSGGLWFECRLVQ